MKALNSHFLAFRRFISSFSGLLGMQMGRSYFRYLLPSSCPFKQPLILRNGWGKSANDEGELLSVVLFRYSWPSWGENYLEFLPKDESSHFNYEKYPLFLLKDWSKILLTWGQYCDAIHFLDFRVFWCQGARHSMTPLKSTPLHQTCPRVQNFKGSQGFVSDKKLTTSQLVSSLFLQINGGYFLHQKHFQPTNSRGLLNFNSALPTLFSLILNWAIFQSDGFSAFITEENCSSSQFLWPPTILRIVMTFKKVRCIKWMVIFTMKYGFHFQKDLGSNHWNRR